MATPQNTTASTPLSSSSTHTAQLTKEKKNEKTLDQALEDTFPASDPVALVSPKPKKQEQ